MDLPNTRTCNGCSLCCTVMAVYELPKPSNVRCEHLSAMGRCKIYATKPETCTGFRCLWLQGLMPDRLKPSIARVVGDVNKDGTIIVLHVSPFDTGAWEKAPVQEWIGKVVEAGITVIVACGERRILYGTNLDPRLQVVKDPENPEMWHLVIPDPEEAS
jgi:hypothetical protein